MRRRRGRRWLLPIVVWTTCSAAMGRAQTVSLPPALDDRQRPRPERPKQRRRILGLEGAQTPPPAPQPIPGPAGIGLPGGGMDAPDAAGPADQSRDCMQLAGVRPLDIAAATQQVEQALALQLQARALWVPNLNAGVDYFRHDGVQQNIFTGGNFQKGRQSFFVGGGP